MFICTSNRDFAGNRVTAHDPIIQLVPTNFSTSDFGYTNKTSVYPVPASQEINIDTKLEAAFISIVSINGKEIYFEKISKKKNVNHLKSGLN